MGEYDEYVQTQDYDKTHEVVLGWNPAKYVSLVQQYAPKSASILDAGCGTGRLAEGLREAGHEGPIDGFDVSEEMVKVCAGRNVFQKAYVHDMYQKFPCDDGEYDLVMTTAALMFVEKKGLMSEFVRCIKPGGHLLIASRQDRMRKFGYTDELDALVSSQTLKQVHSEVGALTGQKKAYLKEDFHYMTFVFEKLADERCKGESKDDGDNCGSEFIAA